MICRSKNITYFKTSDLFFDLLFLMLLILRAQVCLPTGSWPFKRTTQDEANAEVTKSSAT